MATDAENLLTALDAARAAASNARVHLVNAADFAIGAGLDVHKVEAINGVGSSLQSTLENIEALLANEGGTRG